MDKLKDYLYGAYFMVKINNYLLTYILPTARLDVAGHRWLVTLSGFCFSLKYHPGVENRDADALSRRLYDPDPETSSEEWTQVTSEGLEAFCQ